jgi:mono/diheme cytochrome c family protein
MRFGSILGGLAPLLLMACATADDGGRSFRDTLATIFEQRCVSCHGAHEPKGGFSLTSRQTALAGGDSGPAIVPGQPDEGMLLGYISGDKPEMPKSGAPLRADEVAAIRAWINDGARWPAEMTLVDKSKSGPWWSLGPLVRPAVPKVDTAWVRTPIDAFVLAKHDELGLHHAPEADRRTLIRRLTFDLHGLPPLPDDVDAFVADDGVDAYEQLVDRLLASERYGERWGRYWLDIVHYGESHGYDKDKPRPNAWPYRDYVIRALNSDKPYSRFVLEQLAGDVLYPDDPQATIATGFVAAGPWDFVGHMELREGTVDKAIARSNDRDDMLMATMSTFVSLTVHCARCHDHKFDPIPQDDYYRLQAVFAGVDRGDRPYRDAESSRERELTLRARDEAAHDQTKLEERIAALTGPEVARLDQRITTVLSELAATADPLGRTDDSPASPTNGYHSEISATAAVAKWVQVDLGASLPIEVIRLLPARPTDFADTPGFGFPLRFRIAISDDPTFVQQNVVVHESQQDFANPGDQSYSVNLPRLSARYVRVTADKLWPRSGDFVFALAEMQIESGARNVAAGAAVAALDSIEGGRWGKQNLVDGFSSRHGLPDLALPAVAQVLRQREARQHELANLRTERAQRADELIPASVREELAAVRARLAELDEQLAALEKDPLVYALKSIEPRPIHLLRRGDVKSPAELIQPGALGCVHGLARDFVLPNVQEEGSRRAALAHWIVDPANVLARRSIVNRVWQYHFGAGLVDTPNDFGRMGSQPSHPQLLDWLAVEFLEQGESLKKLHKLVVTSSVYRQASAEDADNARLDGANRFLWRQNRRRLDAEAVRDAALSVSGKLDLTMGGPAVRQFAFKDDHSPIYDYARFDVDNPAACRRSVYRFIVRSVPDPLMDCLDCADPSLLTPRRNTTLTSLQALAMLNNALFVRQAEHFAARVQEAAHTPTGQIRAAYRLALARAPRADEMQLLLAYTAEHGLANTCRLIFNANEFVFVD